ncbi:DUF1737 domain-containing protein [Thalassococcus sp. CAU 1522]|uniref:DUF1737 domain-containing protein n=1 Tax=Thalassococcus arenae TaxID=2851652 RepID=A0ABS6N866_9RHOB|nr:DUF1737 domain-containing protein [Thalassococcus arenae]MBV2360214.1 DUF1737 domain-containing protein [Thalassococcus arenae]
MKTPAHVTDYKIFSDTDPVALAQAVVSAIHDGWQPWGALTVADGQGDARYSQAMVRYAEWA